MIRIAVVGGGPKSLFALLALNDRLSSTPSAPVTVDVYDPQPPGAGSVWRTNQPETLRLNVQAGIVEATSSLSAETFTVWAQRVAPEMGPVHYPPRRLVGRYLQEQFQLLSLRGSITVGHVPEVVTGVERKGPVWQVSGTFGANTYDEVLLATGHGLAQAPAADPMKGAVNRFPLIGDYAALTPEALPAGSEVWIRGAALTAYDVAMLLTEGRGGDWQWTNDSGDGARLRYRSCGEEPRLIIFSSRSGTLMLPKSEMVPGEVVACLEGHKASLREWGQEVRETDAPAELSLSGLWLILVRCAQDCARVMGLDVSALALWRTALTGHSAVAGCGAADPERPHNAAAFLERALAVNQLQAPVTTGWLWARVWSGLYAELVAAMDRLPRTARDWRQFARVAHSLEKITFGPPELTARKLAVLIDAGLIQLATTEQTPPPAAILVDAVTPGPGVLPAAAPAGTPTSELFAGLLHRGDISIRPGDRGLLTASDGTCIALSGSRNESLAALGRPTEDPTLGHDTLNRSLHGEHLLWAQRIAGLITDRLNH
ncbi:FAD/NAD(P)-binding protein [Arthrobacter alpinus]|uniref:FAD/NAD(P)-binding protein n=1 Tax=Arthrobacter alpinus TaxID=656366 RepID=UPI0016446E53|nr:FAD/NAD(P)-binding protein [Arthrobacter alpinus]